MSKRSDNVTRGIEKAPMRSLFYAMGYTKEELERPLIGVVSAHSEIVPGHIHLDKITEAVKGGRAHGRRYADHGAGHRRVRRHRHGAHRHEILAGQP